MGPVTPIMILLSAFTLSPFLSVSAEGGNNATQACQEISKKVSNASAVLYPLDPGFASDIEHWFLSSTQIPKCVVEVGSTADVSTAIKTVASLRTPFAVMSGGHASNPGFSSTNGVHISFARMTQVDLSPDTSTVEIGMGETWAGVYQKLDGSGVNVVGGRTPGPGVGGFTLGGGFSWKTNQFGLTCDNVQCFTLVLPNGTIADVDSSQPDLFFALKGGLNRFGIVTTAKYNTHPQVAAIYGGISIYEPDKTAAVLEATTAFYKQNTDPKAQIITTISGSLIGTSALVLFFYDGPSRPVSFAPFNNISALVDTVKTQSFSSFVSGIPSKLATIANERGTFNTLSTSALTPAFLNAVKNESDTYGSLMALYGGLMVSYDIEPFLSSYGNKSTDSAYPHVDSPLPLNVYFSWLSSLDDDFWYAAIRASIARLKEAAIQEGIYKDDFTAYPNYAVTGTTARELYGQNTARLEAIRAQVDHQNVMELAGGFELTG